MEIRKKLHVLRCNVYMLEKRGGKSKHFDGDLEKITSPKLTDKNN